MNPAPSTSQVLSGTTESLDALNGDGTRVKTSRPSGNGNEHTLRAGGSTFASAKRDAQPPSRVRLPPRSAVKPPEGTHQEARLAFEMPAPFVTTSIWREILTRGARAIDNQVVWRSGSMVSRQEEEEEVEPPEPLRVDVSDSQTVGTDGKCCKLALATYRTQDECNAVAQLFHEHKMLPKLFLQVIKIEDSSRQDQAWNSALRGTPTPLNTLLTPIVPPEIEMALTPVPMRRSVTFTKLPLFVTTRVFTHYLLWGIRTFDHLAIYEIRNLDKLLEQDKIEPPPNSALQKKEDELPPVPLAVQVWTDGDSNFAEAHYASKADVAKVYKLFNGKKVFSCLDGGGIGVKT